MKWLTTVPAFFWKHRIALILNVVAGVIVLLISYLFGWWPTIWNWVRSGYVWLAEESSVPHWFLLLLVATSLTLLLLVTQKLTQWWRNKRPPEWHQYKEDYFYRWFWRWDYDKEGHPIDPRCYCRKCNCKTAPKVQLSGALSCLCPRCKVQGEEEGIGWSWKDNIRSLVTQRIESGEWQNADTFAKRKARKQDSQN